MVVLRYQLKCCLKLTQKLQYVSMLLWSALKEARSSKSSLANIWLDIANAYGSIPHRLIFFALERYGVPPKWISIIKKYYVSLWSKSFSDNAPSNWHQHLRGIFAGCTVSIILFLAGINAILEYAMLSSAPNFISSSKTALPLIRGFMDDINIMSTSVAGAQDLLARCSTALKWAGMDYCADKSRSIVIIKGKTMNTTHFTASEPANSTDISCYIPSIQSMPVKFLGRIIDGSISYRKALDELQEKLFEGLKIIDKSSFKGTQKLWILQHLLIPRVQWTLMIYEVPMTFALKLEQKISTFIRKWLKLHNSTSNLCFYSSSSPCPLPVKSLTSILKSAKISGHLLLRDSKDPLVTSSPPSLPSGSWDASDTVRCAESSLTFQKVVGKNQLGRAGLGYSKSIITPDKRSHGYRKLVSSVAKDIDEECIYVKAVQLHLQGQWTRWSDYVQKNLSWNTLLAMPINLLSLTFDTLPSPNNLLRWRIAAEPCFLCDKEICTTAHILGACKKLCHKDGSHSDTTLS